MSILLKSVCEMSAGLERTSTLLFKSHPYPCLRLHYRHLAQNGFFHTFRVPNMRLFNNIMVAVSSQDEAKGSDR